MELTWKVTGLKTLTIPDLGNFVSEVTWRMSGADADGVEGYVNGASYYEVTEANADTFTPYEELTEEQVLQWVRDGITEDQQNHLNFLLNKEIEANKYSAAQSDTFPWQPEPPTPETTAPDNLS